MNVEEITKKLVSFFHKKSFLRIISVLCAILLWFYVSAVESPASEKEFDSIAITLRNKDVMMSATELSVISDSVYETTVTLSGKKSALNKVDYEEIIATIDLSDIKEAGTHELPIIVTAPSGTSVASVNPKYITVSVDKTTASQINIEPDISYNNLPTTYELGECVLTDSQSKPLTTVTVSGPAKEIERIDRVVARVDFGSINSSVEAKTNLLLLDSLGEEITSTSIRLNPQSVIVKQPVYVTKTLPLSVTQANNTFSESQISFRIKPSSVEVKGDPKILEELNNLSLDPINERTISDAMTTTVNSLIKLPDGLELVGMQNTATITVNLRNVKTNKINVTQDNLTVINAPEAMDVRFDDFEWSVLVMNASTKAITIDDIKLELDLSNYVSSGIYTVEITPKFNRDIQYAYFPNANYSVSFELVKKVGE